MQSTKLCDAELFQIIAHLFYSFVHSFLTILLFDSDFLDHLGKVLYFCCCCLAFLSKLHKLFLSWSQLKEKLAWIVFLFWYFLFEFLNFFTCFVFSMGNFVIEILFVLFYLQNCILDTSQAVGCLLLDFFNPFFHRKAAFLNPWPIHAFLQCPFDKFLLPLLAEEQTFVNIVVDFVSENFELSLIHFVPGVEGDWDWIFGGLHDLALLVLEGRDGLFPCFPG